MLEVISFTVTWLWLGPLALVCTQQLDTWILLVLMKSFKFTKVTTLHALYYKSEVSSSYGFFFTHVWIYSFLACHERGTLSGLVCRFSHYRPLTQGTSCCSKAAPPPSPPLPNTQFPLPTGHNSKHPGRKNCHTRFHVTTSHKLPCHLSHMQSLTPDSGLRRSQGYEGHG